MHNKPRRLSYCLLWLRSGEIALGVSKTSTEDGHNGEHELGGDSQALCWCVVFSRRWGSPSASPRDAALSQTGLAELRRGVSERFQGMEGHRSLAVWRGRLEMYTDNTLQLDKPIHATANWPEVDRGCIDALQVGQRKPARAH